MHTYTHAYIHTYIHTYIRIRTYIHTYILTRIHTKCGKPLDCNALIYYLVPATSDIHSNGYIHVRIKLADFSICAQLCKNPPLMHIQIREFDTTYVT